MSNVVESSTTIAIQAHRLWNLPSDELCAQKAVNKDRFKRRCIVCRDRDPSGSQGVGYAEVVIEGFYCTSIAVTLDQQNVIVYRSK